MQFDLSAQGWTAGVNALLALIFIVIPQAKHWFENQAEEYRAAIRGITAIVLGVVFVGGSCVGWWGDLACAKADVLSFAGNVVIASVLGFQASGAVMHVTSVTRRVAINKMLRAQARVRGE